ncbi:MAG: 3-phosphoshikimate 1-carboxyvinyltransferase [Candidatus Marinimicrobia bacterium]|nr:3-phosphoshikimate 1-carboxyvinyltransferase [Candidatus Neomarinimicrobiota bacterium]
MKTNEITIKSTKSVTGQITLPGDKSISHRALFFAGLAEGTSQIKFLNNGADVLSTVGCLQKLGVKFQLGKYRVEVDSAGFKKWNKTIEEPINCGNSGTTTRLLAGLVAGLCIKAKIIGDDSLTARPMKRIIKPLKKMGADIDSDNGKLPMIFNGNKLRGIRYTMPVASAQVKSCLLLAGLFSDGKTFITEKLQSRDHTERMMKIFGISIFKKKDVISISKRKKPILPFKYSVPGDPSAAAFWITAGLLVPNSKLVLKRVSLNSSRISYIKLLQKFGCKIQLKEIDKSLEPFGDITVQSSKIKPFSINKKISASIIDEVPILALIATQAHGKSSFRGLKELRYKESDRIKSVVENLKKLGADITEYPTGFDIVGPTKLKGNNVDSFGDHRIAMMLAIAGLISDSDVKIKNHSIVNISYPDFYKILKRISK